MMTNLPHDRSPGSAGRRPHPVWVYLVPIFMLAGLPLIFLISPRFYLDYVLHTRIRETQAVEIVTAGSAFLAGVLLWVQGWRLWRGGGSTPGRGGAGIVLLIGAAALFFAGEEISWGQSYFGWDTPEAYRELSGETNLHNTDLPVNSLGSVFLVVMFFGLPIVWATGWPRRPPASWGPAIAEPPVIFCTACGFVWKEVKTVYKLVNPDYREQTTYIDFFEQLNEHKEMIVAVALLMYALYRVGAVRRALAGDVSR